MNNFKDFVSTKDRGSIAERTRIAIGLKIFLVENKIVKANVDRINPH